MRRRSLQVTVRLLAVVAAFLVLSPPPGASAYGSFDNLVPTLSYDHPCIDASFESPGYLCLTDNSSWTLWIESSVSATDRGLIRSVIDNQFGPTDLTPIWASAPTYSGTSETDLIYQMRSSGWSSNLIGKTWCNSTASSYYVQCDQHYVALRPGWVDAELACHESGHAVGLTHGDTAYPRLANDNAYLFCMETPDMGNRPTLGSHNIGAINEHYV